jgi:hypothetical protein
MSTSVANKVLQQAAQPQDGHAPAAGGAAGGTTAAQRQQHLLRCQPLAVGPHGQQLHHQVQEAQPPAVDAEARAPVPVALPPDWLPQCLAVEAQSHGQAAQQVLAAPRSRCL